MSSTLERVNPCAIERTEMTENRYTRKTARIRDGGCTKGNVYIADAKDADLDKHGIGPDWSLGDELMTTPTRRCPLAP